MKMRTEEKARMAYINKMNNYLSYDYDKEVKDYMKEHGEEVNKYLEKAFSKSSGSEWFNKSLARVYVIMPRDREHYNAYMTEYRKSQRERIDQVLDQVSELITIMKENQIIKTEVSRAKRGY